MSLDKSSSSMKFPLFLSGVTAAAGLGYLYYRSVYAKPGADLELSAEQVKSILKEFRRDFYPIFKYLTNLSQKVQGEYKKKFNYIPDNIKNNLNSMLIDENPAFKEMVNAMEDKVYGKFSINNRSGFESFVLNLSKVNTEVQVLVNEIKNDFRKALMGVVVSETIDLPEFVNPDMILDIYKDSLKLVIQNILSFVVDYKERHGEISAYDENFALQLKDLNLEQMKLKVLEERGLGNYEDYHPERLFHYALAKYSKEKQDFKDRLVKMEVFHQTLIQKFFVPNANFNDLQRELEGIDKLTEVEDLVIKEIKDEWEDVAEDKIEEEYIEAEIEPKVEEKAEEQNQFEDKADEHNQVNAGDDHATSEQIEDHTETSTMYSNEVLEQIEEFRIHPEPNEEDIGIVHCLEDKNSESDDEDSAEIINDSTDMKPKETREVHSNHKKNGFTKNENPVVEVIDHDDFRLQESQTKLEEPVSGKNSDTVE